MVDFLNSSKYCSWSANSKLAKQAKKLSKRTKKDTIAEIYRFVSTNFHYDNDKAALLKGTRGYVPDPESVYESRSGICFDKASLMCAMLRSLNIPAKLVVGTIDGASHAWVSAFDGNKWLKYDPTMLGWQKDKEYITKYEL